MKYAACWRLVAVVALLTACGPASPTAAVTSPSAVTTPSASPSGTPAPAPGTCDPTHRCLALVALSPGGVAVVRDVTDISHPKTVTTFEHSWPQFVNGTTVSYVDGPTLFSSPVSGLGTEVVADTGDQFTGIYSWSPDGKTVAYLAPTSTGTALHLVTAGHDQVVDSALPAVPAVGCENEPCPGADTWDFRLSYSPDGAHITMVLSLPGVNVFRMWSADGKVVTSLATQSRSMSAWSGTGFYFPDEKGVELLRNGATTVFLPGVSWIHPNASQSGRQVAYETRDAQGWHHVSVVDTQTGQVRELKKGRTYPVFLTSRFVWYRGEGAPGISSGKTYIYDLQAGTETPSVISQVWDVWPHAA